MQKWLTFFWYDLALESKARFFASISSKHPFTSGFLIYTAKQWNDGSTMHFLVLQGLKLTVKQDYSPTYIFPFPKSSSIPIRYFQLRMVLSCFWSDTDPIRYRSDPMFLQVNLHLRCRMVTWFYLVFIIYFEVFLQVNVDLRCRMVTRVYLDVLIYFKLFLQVNMDLRCRMVTCIYLDFIFYVFFSSCFCK